MKRTTIYLLGLLSGKGATGTFIRLISITFLINSGVRI